MDLKVEILNEIVEICRKYDYIDRVILFGSRARGDNSLKSDIDLGIYSKRPIGEFIEDIELNTKTLLEYDFTHMDRIKDKLLIEQIDKDGIIIYEKHRV